MSISVRTRTDEGEKGNAAPEAPRAHAGPRLSHGQSLGGHPETPREGPGDTGDAYPLVFLSAHAGQDLLQICFL